MNAEMAGMNVLSARELHQSLGAIFVDIQEQEAVLHYGDWRSEYNALQTAAGVLDLSFRSRICLLGADRMKFLHGQVTQAVESLQTGQGCYALLVNAKARIQSDLHIYRLADEILLDFEPGLTAAVSQRLDQYIIADDVQIVDVAPHYGLASVQGPASPRVIESLGLDLPGSMSDRGITSTKVEDVGDIYCSRHGRLGSIGFDVFVPVPATAMVLDKLIALAKAVGGLPCGWQAMETARIEAGIPRYGQDMDESNLAPEAGVTERAISYTKGCYIGQEVIARIRTYGHVTKELRELLLPNDPSPLPVRGSKLFHQGKEAGYITSAAHSPRSNANIALGYVRKECNATGSKLHLVPEPYGAPVVVACLPF